MTTIYNILDSSYTKTDNYTHQTMNVYRGKYRLDHKQINHFWKSYTQELENNPNCREFFYGIAEKPHLETPIIADIDLKKVATGLFKPGEKVDADIEDPDEVFESEGKHEGKHDTTDSKIMKPDPELIERIKRHKKKLLYTQAEITTIVKIYNEELCKIINLEPDDLDCYVLEKPPYFCKTSSGVIYKKNGIHLHYPKIFLNRKAQELFLIPQVIRRVEEESLWEDLGKPSDIIDRSVCRNAWILYGSGKSRQSGAYKLTRIFGHDMRVKTLTESLIDSEYSIYDSKGEVKLSTQNVERMLPRILSIVPHRRRVYRTRPGLQLEPAAAPVVQQRTVSEKANRSRNLEECCKLLELLSVDRCSQYSSWLKVGWILHYESHGKRDGLDQWVDWSKYCDEKFDEIRCLYEWELMTRKSNTNRSNRVTMGTLIYMAREDNPKGYQTYLHNRKLKMVSIECNTHFQIACLLHTMFKDSFKCVSIQKKQWYFFTGVIWKEIDSGVDLRMAISKDITLLFEQLRRKKFLQLADEVGLDEQDSGMKELKLINRIVADLNTSNFKNNIMREACDLFYDRDFYDKLDADPKLIAFNNGVYDLEHNEFRQGTPDDYLSKCMPIEYNQHLSDTAPLVREVRTFIEKVFPDPELRKYFLDMSSDVFEGGNMHKKVIFWVGDGDNAKSKTQELFEVMLGPYAIKMNTQLVTGKKPSAGAANADLARTGGGVRWVVMEEPDRNEEINVGTLKHLSGNDSYFARDLFEKGKGAKEINPMFKLNFIANHLPPLKGADQATFNRVRVLPFESKFLTPDNEAGIKIPQRWNDQMRQKIFPAATMNKKKIKSLAPAFAWVLLEHRLQILGETRIEPKKVKDATNKYKVANDSIRAFLIADIVDEKGATVSIQSIYTEYKEWYHMEKGVQSTCSKQQLKEYIEKVWGPISAQGTWSDHRTKNASEHIN